MGKMKMLVMMTTMMMTIVDDDADYNAEKERERNERIKQMVEENFQNLYGYVEEIWYKNIYNIE